MKLSEHYAHEVVIGRSTWHDNGTERVLEYYLECLECLTELIVQEVTE